jgi:phosphoglucomutase
MEYKNRFKEWMEKVKEPTLKKELEIISANDELIKNCFYKDLEFGTGGMRGVIGVGTNCLNYYTVAKATKGVAEYMNKNNFKTAVISFDSRINSEYFAKSAAEVLASENIIVHIVKELMPTPFLSFAVRYLKADMGIMVTASHNPKEYNGYKVYNFKGCQITDKAAKKIIEFIKGINPFEVFTKNFKDYSDLGKIKFIDEVVEEKYIDGILGLKLYKNKDNLSVVYTPLNGTGYRIVPKILKINGFNNINIVKEQSFPDGDFTTCKYPNPEKSESLELGLNMAKKLKADILLATDPDADRLGVAVLHKGEYRILSGNEVGILLTDYILCMKTKKGILPDKPLIIKTIVTSDLAEKIAKEYNADTINVLTGFKYIGEYIGELEEKNILNRFVLGFEESCGYLGGTYVRDKDAEYAVMAVTEMASYYKENDKTLIDRINEIYDKYGKYEHKLFSFEFFGAEGNEKKQRILDNLRNSPLKSIGEEKIINITDYQYEETGLPKSDVIKYVTEKSKVIIRPSGTEPLIKIYVTIINAKENKMNLFIQEFEKIIS